MIEHVRDHGLWHVFVVGFLKFADLTKKVQARIFIPDTDILSFAARFFDPSLASLIVTGVKMTTFSKWQGAC